MHCPFYLAIAIFVGEGGHTWTESIDIDSNEVDINDVTAVLAAFPTSTMTEAGLFANGNKPKRVMLIANNTSGGPRTVQDWG